MRSLALCALLLILASPAMAQDPPKAPEPEPQIDPTKLGVSISKIQKGLFVAADRDRKAATGGIMRLEFNVQVYGTAPKIEVLKGVDLFNGAVPGTAPSHNQMLEFWTPPIYRSPTMPVSALAFWAAKQIWQKSKKTQCEDEIANYRALIMQGVSVSAPRCTQ
jgi:hypothetical protein